MTYVVPNNLERKIRVHKSLNTAVPKRVGTGTDNMYVRFQ